MKNIGALRCHSEHSIKNSTMSIGELVQKAKELNIDVLGLTDSGSMTGIIEFIDKCKSNGIKAVPGVEIYFDGLHTLCLYAKNYEGFCEINNALKLANENIYTDKVSNINYPIFTMDIMETLNPNNVAITSTGINSIFAGILFKNDDIEEKIREIEKEQENIPNPNDAAFIKNNEVLNNIDIELEELEALKKKITSFSKKECARRLTIIESLRNTEPELYAKKKASFDAEILEIKGMAKNLPDINKKIDNLKTRKKALKLKITSSKKKHTKYYQLQREIENLKEEYEDNALLFQKCENILKWLDYHFAKSFYIELSFNGTEKEKKYLETIIELNKNYGFDYIITNDNRFADKNDADLYQIIRSMEKTVWYELSDYDKGCYLKTDEEIILELKTVIDEKLVERARKTTELFIDSIDFAYPDTSLEENKHYPKYIVSASEEGLDTSIILGHHIEKGILERGFTAETFTETYHNRMVKEYNVIVEMGFADYLLIVEDYIKYGKSLNPNGVGDGRGSAVGSLICYFLGITNLDPIKYNLKFERFLNKDRVSMPDIDVDFSSDIRYKVIDYVADKYGRDTVAFIRTKQTQKGRASIKNVARVLGIRDKNDKMAYYKIAESMANEVPNAPKIKLSDYKDIILEKNKKKICKEILDIALRLEGKMTTVGTHAAGVIIGDGKSLTNYVPIFYNTDMEEWSVACDKKEAEKIGLLKMDFLGLDNLNIISETVSRIKKYDNIDLDMNKIPFEKEVLDEIYAKGNTESVFQFESAGMRDFLKRFKPESFEDLILLNAAYRPGPMQYLDGIIKSKNKESEPKHCLPQLKEILAETYGYPIYQEQLMDIFSICAGFSQSEADVVRNYMCKKITDKFILYKDRFIDGIVNSGAKKEEAVDLWEQLVAFSEYAFNKSHATAYSYISYKTAYLKYHYPEYYMCSVLNNSSVQKLKSVLYECRKMNINLILPDINRAFENFENSRKGIIYGLTRIKGMGNKVLPLIKERDENGAYRSFKEFVRRTRVSDKMIISLINAGCFDGFRSGMRNSLVMAYEDISMILDKIDSINKRITKLENTIESSEKVKKQTYKDYEDAKSELKRAENEYQKYVPLVDIEDNEDNLETENELLGAYISGHPLDPYMQHYKSGRINLLSDVDGSIKNGTFAGIIKNLRITQRKSDNKDMAFFTLEDVSDEIQVCVFTKAYEKFGNTLKEGSVIEIHGNIIEDNEVNKLVVQSINKIRPFKNPIFVSVSDDMVEDIIKTLDAFRSDEGHPVLLHKQSDGSLKNMNIFISKEFLENKPDYAFANILFNY